MEFRILGPLQVVADDGTPLPVGGQRERALLAILLVSANKAVANERLIDDLWGDEPPEGATHALRVNVSRLRKALRETGSQARIATRPGGYAFEVDPHDVDARRFEALVAEGRRLAAGGDHGRTAAILRDALALWRGPALSDVADMSSTGAEARRLEDLRVAALEDRIEADLAAGRHRELVAELEVLTREYSFREHIWELRMIALYRSGRHAEAVRTYQDLRAILAEQLGIEPSPDLERLNVAMLRRDDELLRAPANAVMPTASETKYAKTSGVNIAYQVVGDGPVDVVLVPGFVSNVDLIWENPGWRRIIDGIASTHRLILWDKRGTGLSDPVQRVPTLDERADDLLAVMDAAQSKEAALFGISEGGPMSLLFAATRPERVRGLLLYGVTPRFMQTEGWEWGWSAQDADRVLSDVDARWGEGALIEVFAPGVAADDRAKQTWARTQRAGASPAMGRALVEAMMATDCRDILGAVGVPTLVLHRRGDRVAHVEAGRFIARAIPDARFVELPGDNHLLPAGDLDTLLSEIDAFLAALDAPGAADRALVTVLCVDFEARDDASHAAADRLVAQFDGSIVQRDPILATFITPSAALSCVLSIRRDAPALRAAIHTSECELGVRATDGPPFRIARRLARLASVGQVLATATVRDLVAGSAYVFEDERRYRLDEAGPALRVFTVGG